jgi:hypothetical protein
MHEVMILAFANDEERQVTRIQARDLARLFNTNLNKEKLTITNYFMRPAGRAENSWGIPEGSSGTSIAAPARTGLGDALDRLKRIENLARKACHVTRRGGGQNRGTEALFIREIDSFRRASKSFCTE